MIASVVFIIIGFMYLLSELNWRLLTQQTGHNGYQSCSCSQLQHLLPLQVHLLPVVVQEGAQSQRLQDKQIHPSYCGLLRQQYLLVETCNDFENISFPSMYSFNVFRGTHCWPHHCSKGVYGLMDDNVLPDVVVDIFIKAAVDAGKPGWCCVLLHHCLFDVHLSCEERMDQNFNRGDTIKANI